MVVELYGMGVIVDDDASEAGAAVIAGDGFALRVLSLSKGFASCRDQLQNPWYLLPDIVRGHINR